MPVLIVYFIIMMAVTLLFTDRSTTKEEFLVGDRNIKGILGALSIASSWIWAPALFISSEKAYSHGIVGLFWFMVPNILCLIIFAPFALKIRKYMPEGVTISGYMNEMYSKRVGKIYLIQMAIIALLSTVVQLVAGGMMFSTITGLPFWAITILFILITYSYSQFSGIKASIATDALQMIIMIIVCLVITIGCIVNGNIGAVKNGLGGITGDFNNLFNKHGLEVFLSFGLSSTIGLLSGPFGDQLFWQRAFSIKKTQVKSAFIIGAFIFAIVPLLMGVIGFIAAGSGFLANNVETVNLEFISQNLPMWMTYSFMFMLISGLMSTIDSNLCSIASLTNDIIDNFNIKVSKISMIILSITAIIIANIPGMTVGKLFLIYGTVRASTLLTTILTLKGVKLTEKGVFYGVISSLVIGLPIFWVGSIKNINLLKVLGSLLAVLLSGIVSLVITKIERKSIC